MLYPRQAVAHASPPIVARRCGKRRGTPPRRGRNNARRRRDGTVLPCVDDEFRSLSWRVVTTEQNNPIDHKPRETRAEGDGRVLMSLRASPYTIDVMYDEMRVLKETGAYSCH